MLYFTSKKNNEPTNLSIWLIWLWPYFKPSWTRQWPTYSWPLLISYSNSSLESLSVNPLHRSLPPRNVKSHWQQKPCSEWKRRSWCRNFLHIRSTWLSNTFSPSLVLSNPQLTSSLLVYQTSLHLNFLPRWVFLTTSRGQLETYCSIIVATW